MRYVDDAHFVETLSRALLNLSLINHYVLVVTHSPSLVVGRSIGFGLDTFTFSISHSQVGDEAN